LENWCSGCAASNEFLTRCGEGGGKGRRKKKSDVPTYLPFLRFFEIFRFDFRKYFYGVFGLLMQRNGQKRDKKKSMGKYERKKVFFLSAKSFDMDFPQNVLWCF
jgi:hypothetical protein